MKHVKTQIEMELSFNENKKWSVNEKWKPRGARISFGIWKDYVMQIKMCKTNPVSGGTYRELHRNNQAVLNVKNIDKFCALWFILAKTFPSTTN